MPFSPDSQVDVREVDSTHWELLSPLRYHGQSEIFTVPVGMRTDFASVPRVFVWFLPRYGRYTKAAILHDYLCSGLNSTPISRIDADGIFRRVMRELGVSFLKRWIMWGAVRWGALFTRDGRKGWTKELPRVLVVSAFALPIVIPPATLILVALAVFYALEMVSYVVLQLSAKTREKIGHPSTRIINMPAATWKL